MTRIRHMKGMFFMNPFFFYEILIKTKMTKYANTIYILLYVRVRIIYIFYTWFDMFG